MQVCTCCSVFANSSRYSCFVGIPDKSIMLFRFAISESIQFHAFPYLIKPSMSSWNRRDFIHSLHVNKQPWGHNQWVSWCGFGFVLNISSDSFDNLGFGIAI
ncbi:hypothetical protein HanPSC8_Chr11g0461301 [Helianthus annuus]|nr:hypothetical protein HanPSC8_Chr11g0461301 [Helianthus annuus]